MYAFQDDIIGMPQIGSVGDFRQGPAYPGMLGHAIDPILGGGEFIYLQGCLNTVPGSLVTYNQLAATTLAATGVQGGSPVAVAMAAVGVGQFSWYQVSGNARIAKNGSVIALGAGLTLAATAGHVTAGTTPAGTAGDLDNAICSAAAAASDTLVNVTISRPMVN